MKAKDKAIELNMVELSNICPDFDGDCNSMSIVTATWCFMGCQNHKCIPNSNLGIAKGTCPIIHNTN